MKKATLLLVCLALLSAAGCVRSAAPKFFLLKPIEASGVQPAPLPGISLGVGPVEIPDYLRRSQIARRTEGNEITFSDAFRWAEPLDTSVLRVLSENLSVLRGTPAIALFPWLPSAAPEYQVRVRVVRFDGSDDQVQLAAYWSIYSAGKNAELAARKSVIEEKPASAGMAALVEAQNRALEGLSREIAAALQRAGQPPVGQ